MNDSELLKELKFLRLENAILKKEHKFNSKHLSDKNIYNAIKRGDMRLTEDCELERKCVVCEDFKEFNTFNFNVQYKKEGLDVLCGRCRFCVNEIANAKYREEKNKDKTKKEQILFDSFVFGRQSEKRK